MGFIIFEVIKSIKRQSALDRAFEKKRVSRPTVMRYKTKPVKAPKSKYPRMLPWLALNRNKTTVSAHKIKYRTSSIKETVQSTVSERKRAARPFAGKARNTRDMRRMSKTAPRTAPTLSAYKRIRS